MKEQINNENISNEIISNENSRITSFMEQYDVPRDQMAEILGVSRMTLYRYIKEGHPPYVDNMLDMLGALIEIGHPDYV